MSRAALFARLRRMGMFTTAIALMVGLASPAVADELNSYPFRDPALPLNTRVDDLVKRLTLAEKVSLLHQFQPAIPRLGVPEFKTGTEALHGLGWTTERTNGNVVTANATVFPQAVGLASTWDPALIKKIGSVVGDEARAYHSQDPGFWGLQLWAPVVNLLRDPRWGRNEEGYSEDPLLTGAISTAYGKGMTGDHPQYLKSAPVLKHYLANNNEVDRTTTSSNLRPRVLREYDEQAFKPAIAADAATGVMSSYNLVNGRPATVNPDLNDVVRSWTGKTLYNVSDAAGPHNLTGSQKYYGTSEEGFSAALKAGLDGFTVDNQDSAPTVKIINSALAKGLLAESDIDKAAKHVLSVRFRLGEFDPDGGPYAKIGKDVVNSPAHRELARKSAGEAMVMLKNDRGTLPLDPKRSVAVIGPLEKTLYTDWYSGGLPYKVTPVDGIRARLGAGAKVTDTEAVDRIALRDAATGKYLSGGAGDAGAVLKTGATSVGATEQFDAFDWGQGVLTLRSVANGKYVERQGLANATSPFVNQAPQPRDWFVHQQFKLEDAGDGTVVIKYAGYEIPNDWDGPNSYLTVAADGTLTLGSPNAAGATKFRKEQVTSGIDSAVSAARSAETAVVVVGSMPFINGREDHDRTTMALAESQSELIKAVREANPNTVVVVENSYPTTLNWEQQNVPAILWTSHAGQETGNALADVLYGDVNPAGRLTQTWYRSDADLPDILDYDIMKRGSTYQYFNGDPLYSFGHGLSYTNFRYSDLRLGKPGPQGTFEATVNVTNTGKRAGDEVVQLYTRQLISRDKQPKQQLRGFERVNLQPGQTKTVRLSVPDLRHWDVTRGKWVLETSVHEVMVGASASDIRLRSALPVRGEQIPPRDLTKDTRAIDFDDYSGVELVDESKVRGEAVGVGAGDWLRFSDVDFRSGAKTFTAKTARAEAGTSTVEIRLGGPRGRLVGTAQIAGTGDKYKYSTTTTTVSGLSGRQDVYLVFTSDARISTFSLR